MGVLQSSLLQGFLLHLMFSVIHVQIRHRPRDASSDLARCSRFSRSAIMNHSFLAPYIATIGDSVQGSPLLLNKWESPSSHSDFTIFVSAATITLSTRIIQIAINNLQQWTKTKGTRFSTEKLWLSILRKERKAKNHS